MSFSADAIGGELASAVSRAREIMRPPPPFHHRVAPMATHHYLPERRCSSPFYAARFSLLRLLIDASMAAVPPFDLPLSIAGASRHYAAFPRFTFSSRIPPSSPLRWISQRRLIAKDAAERYTARGSSICLATLAADEASMKRAVCRYVVRFAAAAVSRRRVASSASGRARQASSR